MGKIRSFFTGAAIGALIALAFAPKTGEQARAFVAEKAGAVAGEAKDFGANLPANLQEAVKTATSKGQEFAADATAKVKGATGGAPASAVTDDDLREKIEAARQRIAAQVMENAEASKAVEVAAEA